MPARRDKRNGRWFFRTTIRLPGSKKRLFGVPGVPGPYHRFPNTKVGAQAAEQLAVQQAFGVVAGDVPQKVEVPTFTEWFKGRFWDEWVVGRKNKPTELRSKNIIFELHLKPRSAR